MPNYNSDEHPIIVTERDGTIVDGATTVSEVDVLTVRRRDQVLVVPETAHLIIEWCVTFDIPHLAVRDAPPSYRSGEVLRGVDLIDLPRGNPSSLHRFDLDQYPVAVVTDRVVEGGTTPMGIGRQGPRARHYSIHEGLGDRVILDPDLPHIMVAGGVYERFLDPPPLEYDITDWDNVFALFDESDKLLEVANNSGRLLRQCPGQPAWVAVPEAGMVSLIHSFLPMARVVVRGFPNVVPEDWTTVPPTGPHERECHDCGEVFVIEDLELAANGTLMCDNCSATCAECTRVVPISEVEEMETDMAMSADVCENCRITCWSCDCVMARSMIYDVRGDAYCQHCVECCENCGCYFPEEEQCFNCRGRGIEPYRQTHPSLWLGGPVPRVEEKGAWGNYYVGIENEITATGGYYEGEGAHEAAQEVFGVRALECKEDSSVDGFELAFQPMTPDYFESVDWEAFFTRFNRAYPEADEEPTSHGLHVHIGRMALSRWDPKISQFRQDRPAVAAFTYLLAMGPLERIGRRRPTEYCAKIDKPVSMVKHGYGSRGAVSLSRAGTIEVRAFRATRRADDLRNAVRMVYIGAEYIRYLRDSGPLKPDYLKWDVFCEWVLTNYPYAYTALSGSNKRPAPQTLTSSVDAEQMGGVPVDQHVAQREPVAYRAVPQPMPSPMRFVEVDDIF